MEIFLEFLFDLFLDGCFDIISNKEINVLIRKIALVFFTLIYLGLIIGFLILIFKIKNIGIKILFILVTILIIMVLLKLWLKVYKSKDFL